MVPSDGSIVGFVENEAEGIILGNDDGASVSMAENEIKGSYLMSRVPCLPNLNVKIVLLPFVSRLG